MKRVDMTNVKEAGEFSRPRPGAYHLYYHYTGSDYGNRAGILEGGGRGYPRVLRNGVINWDLLFCQMAAGWTTRNT